MAYDLGHSVTFMAKPTTGWANGLHIHHSLQREGEPVFHDPEAPDGRSQLMRRWLAGLMATLDGAVSLLVPTVNSYRRMVEWGAAPTTPTWDEENKSTALRLVSRAKGVARIEHRVGSGELNPHIAAAVILAGGMAGLDEKLEPPEPCSRMAWGLPAEQPRLPRTILAAADALESDERLRHRLGPAFVEHWINTRRWEQRMFTTQGGDAKAATVTDWELRRYFELA